MHSIRTLLKIGNGPSSSHTMGPKKATRYVMEKYPDAKKIEATLYGSLAMTGKGHLTDYIMDLEMQDIPHKIIFDIKDEVNHPNTMKFVITDKDDKVHTEIIYSIGGGQISIKGASANGEKEVYSLKTFTDIRRFCEIHNLSLVDYVESCEDKDIREYAENIYQVMMDSINRGLTTEGDLPGNLHVQRKANEIFNNVSHNEDAVRREKRLVSSYAFATSEENASGGKIVTAPTCGSSGVIPSLIHFLEDDGISHGDLIDGLLVAGLVGLIVRENASISGAECGCQAEIGTACAMGAALVAQARHLSLDKIEKASEIALEHNLGLTCDPVQGYVQIPCIERNAVASLRALEAATLSELFGKTNSKISLDVVIETMKETGIDINKNYRETSQGGLAKTYK